MKQHQIKGFSFIETLIAVVVLSVAFLALATLMTRVQGLKGKNTRFQEAKYLNTKKLSEVAAIEFTKLATGTDEQTNKTFGAQREGIVTYGPLNKQGQTSQESNQGPFIYTQSFVVCLDESEGGGNASGTGDPCGNIVQSRPPELSCDVTRTDDGQAEVRVLTTYRDRDGKCHAFKVSNIVTDLEYE